MPYYPAFILIMIYPYKVKSDFIVSILFHVDQRTRRTFCWRILFKDVRLHDWSEDLNGICP